MARIGVACHAPVRQDHATQGSGRRPFAIVDIHALDVSDMDATSLVILRFRVSRVLAPSMAATYLRLSPKGRRSKATLAWGSSRKALARSGGGATTLGAVSSLRSTKTLSPSVIPLATRFVALIPTRHCPRIRAILLRHVWPLIVTVIRGRGPERRASTTFFGVSTPVALPEGMTLALNFMSTSSDCPAATPTVAGGIPLRPRRWSDRWQRSALGQQRPCRRRGQRDGPVRPNTAGRRACACHHRAAPDRQVPCVDPQSPRVRRRG